MAGIPVGDSVVLPGRSIMSNECSVNLEKLLRIPRPALACVECQWDGNVASCQGDGGASLGFVPRPPADFPSMDMGLSGETAPRGPKEAVITCGGHEFGAEVPFNS